MLVGSVKKYYPHRSIGTFLQHNKSLSAHQVLLQVLQHCAHNMPPKQAILALVVIKPGATGIPSSSLHTAPQGEYGADCTRSEVKQKDQVFDDAGEAEFEGSGLDCAEGEMITMHS
jgi:hypothetical protein